MRLINELIELEKQQIIDAHNHGEYNSQFMDALDDIDSIEYYNKTYTK
jgi:N-acetylglucosamine-6-phosphate deacetylase